MCKDRNHHHRDERILGYSGEHGLERIPPHEFERTVRVGNPDLPKHPVQKAHHRCDEASEPAILPLRAKTEHEIAFVSEFPKSPEIRRTMLTITVGLKDEFSLHVAEPPQQSLAVPAIDLA